MVNAISGSICMRRFYRKVPRKNPINKHQNNINTQHIKNDINTQHIKNDINGIQQENNVQQCQCCGTLQFQQNHNIHLNQNAQHIQGTRRNLNNENSGLQRSQDV